MQPTPADAIQALRAATAALDVVVATLPTVETGTAAEVAEALHEMGTVARLADAALVTITGIVTERSDGVDPDHSVARLAGHPNARACIGVETGLRSRTVRRLQHLARRTTPTISLTGATIEAGYPLVAAALHDGALSIDQADAIVTPLDEASPRCDPDQRRAAEHYAVLAATGRFDDPQPPLTPESCADLARNLRDRLDPDGLEGRHHDLRQQRYLRAGIRHDGMIAGTFLLPPREGGQLLQALHAHGKPGTKPRFVTVDEGADPEDAAPVVDDRTTAQRDADTLAGLIAIAVEHADAPRIGGEAPTLVVQITQAARDAHARGDTLTPDGEPVTATIEHTGAHIPVPEAETITCDGHQQTITTDPTGHPLHLGRTSRLFTTAIRRAVITRDRHCIGCGKPPGFCQTHHIQWWSHGGPTDIDNALLVCDWCHHEIHRGRLQPQLDTRGRWRLHPALPARGRHRHLTRNALQPAA